jgi:hypothetical protein
MSSALYLAANLGDQVSVFVSPSDKVAHLYPQAPGSLFIVFSESFPWGLMRQGREADHFPSSSAEVKNMWIYTSTLPYAFMAYCLINSMQGQFYRCLENKYLNLIKKKLTFAGWRGLAWR